jgi:hypothetical protein
LEVVESHSDRRTVIVAVVIGIAVLAVAGIALAGIRAHGRRETCLWNLSRIGLVVVAAEGQKAAGWDKIDPGRRFFLEFAEWPGPSPFPFDPRWFCCPVVAPADPGRIDYRGPAGPLRGMDRNDPIVADKPGNHGSGSGGNVVLRSGMAKSVEETDPSWTRAAVTTTEN